MANNPLKEQAAKIKQDLFDQGSLDLTFEAVERNFGSDPQFHKIMVNMLFNNSTKYLAEADRTMQKRPIDFETLRGRVEKVRMANLSSGAKKVRELCAETARCCWQKNADGCQDAFEQLKTEHTTLIEKIRTYLELLARAGVYAGADAGASSSTDQKE